MHVLVQAPRLLDLLGGLGLERLERLLLRLLLLLLPVLFMAACEGGEIILNLDVYSFLEPEAAQRIFPLARAKGVGVLGMKRRWLA